MEEEFYIYQPEEWSKENPPSQEEMEKVLDFFWASKARYGDYDKKTKGMLELYAISNTYKEDLTDIEKKVHKINSIHNTRLPAKSMAEHIFAIKDINNRLQKGDLSLVSDIARANIVNNKGVKKNNCYVFASSFCRYLNPKEFPAYSTEIKEQLEHWIAKFANNKWDTKYLKSDCNNYTKLKEILLDFADTYHLTFDKVKSEFDFIDSKYFNKNSKAEDYKLIGVDLYLWVRGREINKRNKEQNK